MRSSESALSQYDSQTNHGETDPSQEGKSKRLFNYYVHVETGARIIVTFGEHRHLQLKTANEPVRLHQERCSDRNGNG